LRDICRNTAPSPFLFSLIHNFLNKYYHTYKNNYYLCALK
jgi:hypothetical protein